MIEAKENDFLGDAELFDEGENLTATNDIGKDGIGKDGTGISQPLVPVFLMVDTSWSMNENNEYGGDTKIQAVQKAVQEIGKELAAWQDDTGDIMRVSVLCFDSEVKWKYENRDPSELMNISFTADGATHIGDAFMKLEELLHHEKFDDLGVSLYKRAVIVLLTDGCDCGSTITPDAGIRTLRQNNWFVTGTRIAFAVGADADIAPLEKFTGLREAVIKTSKVNVLRSLLEKLVVKASVTSSKGPNVGLNSEEQRAFDVKFQQSAEATKTIIEQVLISEPVNGDDLDDFDLFGDVDPL